MSTDRATGGPPLPDQVHAEQHLPEYVRVEARGFRLDHHKVIAVEVCCRVFATADRAEGTRRAARARRPGGKPRSLCLGILQITDYDRDLA
jgi:hypothetical protein